MENTKTILIVEDDPIFQLPLADSLMGEGFQVLVAKDGEEGLATALLKKPDLLILDLMLPKMDGMSILRKVRESEWGAKVPVFILTALSSSDEKRHEDITKLEPTYYLEKQHLDLTDILDKAHEQLG